MPDLKPTCPIACLALGLSKPNIPANDHDPLLRNIRKPLASHQDC
jgi:hypothetical protein